MERLIIRPAASTSLLTVAVLTMGMFYIINFFTLRVFPFGAVPRRFPSLFPASTVSIGDSVISMQKLGTFVVGIGAHGRPGRVLPVRAVRSRNACIGR